MKVKSTRIFNSNAPVVVGGAMRVTVSWVGRRFHRKAITIGAKFKWASRERDLIIEWLKGN